MRFLAVTLFGIYGLANASYGGYEPGAFALSEPPKVRGSRIGTRGTYGRAGGSSRTSSPVRVGIPPPVEHDYEPANLDLVFAECADEIEEIKRRREGRKSKIYGMIERVYRGYLPEVYLDDIRKFAQEDEADIKKFIEKNWGHTGPEADRLMGRAFKLTEAELRERDLATGGTYGGAGGSSRPSSPVDVVTPRSLRSSPKGGDGESEGLDVAPIPGYTEYKAEALQAELDKLNRMIEAEKFARIEAIKRMREDGKTQIEWGLNGVDGDGKAKLRLELIEIYERDIQDHIKRIWHLSEEDSDRLMELAAVPVADE